MSTKPAYEELEKEVFKLKRVEKELQEHNHYLRSLLNNVYVDIMVLDRDYRITDVNKNFLTTSGRTRDEVIGRHCYEISHGYDAPCENHGEECMLRKVFSTGEPSNFIHQHLHSEGWKVWVSILMSPLKNRKGKVTHVVEVMKDITDLVKSEKDL
jgi:PAS domain S-box-containing protein